MSRVCLALLGLLAIVLAACGTTYEVPAAPTITVPSIPKPPTAEEATFKARLIGAGFGTSVKVKTDNAEDKTKVLEAVVTVRGCKLELESPIGRGDLNYYLAELHVGGKEPNWPGPRAVNPTKADVEKLVMERKPKLSQLTQCRK